MKTIRKHLQLITLFFSFTFLLQSCKAYHTNSVTLEEAIQSSKRVKVKSFRDDIYIFNKLGIEDDKLYGLTKKKSLTAKKLAFQNYEEFENRNYVKIWLPNNIIKEIHPQNKTKSTVVSIVFPVLIVIGVLAILQPGNVGSGSLGSPLYF